jgi:N-acetylglutamate synthase-like GNAT family acetyltransferase
MTENNELILTVKDAELLLDLFGNAEEDGYILTKDQEQLYEKVKAFLR